MPDTAQPYLFMITTIAVGLIVEPEHLRTQWKLKA